MEISNQIKKYRLKLGLSQEDLAQKVFVTRQTISNWENNKNYPDINSLVLLSTIFDVSLDILVKGDLEKMQEQINTKDIKRLNHDSCIFAVLLIASVISALPLFFYLGIVGIAVWAVVYGAAMYYAFRLEKQKKEHDIQTYKEILAFTEGKRLDEIEKNRELGKRSYQKVLYACASGIIAAVILAVMYLLLK